MVWVTCCLIFDTIEIRLCLIFLCLSQMLFNIWHFEPVWHRVFLQFDIWHTEAHVIVCCFVFDSESFYCFDVFTIVSRMLFDIWQFLSLMSSAGFLNVNYLNHGAVWLWVSWESSWILYNYASCLSCDVIWYLTHEDKWNVSAGYLCVIWIMHLSIVWVGMLFQFCRCMSVIWITNVRYLSGQ